MAASGACASRSARPPFAAVLLLLLLAPLLASNAHAAPSCVELGFSETLVCSSCDKLAQYVEDEELIRECRSCCADDNVPTQIDFIDHHTHKYPSLSVQFVGGQPPVLKMRDTKGEEATISINNWNTETILEYLDKRLRK